MRVDFLIVGAAKSATTSLSFALSLHPKICFSEPKEPQFFSDANWRNNLDTYHSYFKQKAAIYGEGSTNYSKFPFYNKTIYKDIYEYNPKMKIIYIIRNPINRIVSHYNHAFNRGYETLEINKAVKENSLYLEISKYASQIKPYINTFGKENVSICFFEDFIKSPEVVSNSLFQFLKLEPIRFDDTKIHLNSLQSKHDVHYKYDAPKTLTAKIKKALLVFKKYYLFPTKNKTIEDLRLDTKQFIVTTLVSELKEIEVLTNRKLSTWQK